VKSVKPEKDNTKQYKRKETLQWVMKNLIWWAKYKLILRCLLAKNKNMLDF
jgi:hypothetical protein